MATLIEDIEALDPALVTQSEEFLTTFLKEQYPSMDLTEGRVLRNLLLRPAAIFHALNQENFDRLRRSMSMQAIEEDPTLADDDTVDAVMSNYRITRDAGAKASGQVTIVISNLATTPVSQGTVFTANDLEFITANAYVGVTTQAAVIGSSQRLIVRRNDGLYSFTVPVEAAVAGANYMIRRNTRFQVSPEPVGLVDVMATEDFTGGRDAETNADLVERFKLELSPKVFSGRVHIESLLQAAVTDLKATSVVGFGDAEMLRDRHNLFALSTGGKADIYARTAILPESKTVDKTAVLVDAAAKTWQFSIDRDEAPGFYLVEKILPSGAAPDQGSYEIVEEVRWLNLTQVEYEFVPDIDNLIEGAYSRYQTAVVKFTDPDTDTTGLVENESTKVYRVDILAMPNLVTLQDLAIDRGSRNPNADYLVRAPVPAFCAISMTVKYHEDLEAPEAAAIAQAVADRVNAINFKLGCLPASVVHDAVHDVIGKTGTLVVSPLDMAASIRKPAGGFISLRSNNELTVPNLPDEGVTNRTVVFYLPVSAVDVAIEKVTALPI